jgi:hypothetical protein
VLQLLWDFNQDLSRLRITFMATVPKGGPSHTILVTDIPGIRAGTVLDTLCRVSPAAEQGCLVHDWHDRDSAHETLYISTPYTACRLLQ